MRCDEYEFWEHFPELEPEEKDFFYKLLQRIIGSRDKLRAIHIYGQSPDPKIGKYCIKIEF